MREEEKERHVGEGARRGEGETFTQRSEEASHRYRVFRVQGLGFRSRVESLGYGGRCVGFRGAVCRAGGV